MDVPSVGSVDEQVLAERIRSAGLRATQPRLTVLGLLMDLRGHLSADDVLDALAARNLDMPRASVYNVLHDLVDRGLLRVADAGPGRTLYEVGAEWHHHFVCRECSAVFDVPCAVGQKPCLDAKLPGVAVDEAQVIFRGPCPFSGSDDPPSDFDRPPECQCAKS